MPTADEILQELRSLTKTVATMHAAGYEDDEEAAKRHEADAKHHDEEAKRHREAAKKARDDDDDEDAKRHDEEAKRHRMDAKRMREDAVKRHEDAAKKCREAEEEDAAKHHEAEAARMRKEEEDAKRHDDEADEEVKHHEEDAAARKKDGMHPLKMFAMFLRAMTENGAKMDAMKDADNMSLLKHLMDAMTYGPDRTMAKKKQDAAHDDEAEDTALFKRLLRQYNEGDSLDASRSVTDLRQERRLRSIEAAMGEMTKLLTDVVHGMRDLVTDTTQNRRDLATDAHKGQNGGPVRRTMSATGAQWQDKYGRTGTDNVQEKGAEDIEASLDAQGITDPVQRMAAKLRTMGNVYNQ